MTALRGFILSVIPDIEVVKGLDNGVAPPKGQYILLTPLFACRLATNTTNYLQTHQVITQPQKYAMQIDCYGEKSSDHASLLTTLLRDEYACSQFPENIQPLYADDPKLMPFVNAEQLYEKRWVITVYFQYNPVVTISYENNQP
ncbi:MAG: hypothetical protein EOO69_04510 [Moraxellaceae bacterium]|nr:MAG: hypothetical protein EOO69_04510 [Moraxellaceae bacterium]